MTFGDAIEALKVGDRVSRAGWGGISYGEITMQNTPGTSFYLRGTYASGFSGPWNPQHFDMLAEDWFVVEAAHADQFDEIGIS